LPQVTPCARPASSDPATYAPTQAGKAAALAALVGAWDAVITSQAGPGAGAGEAGRYLAGLAGLAGGSAAGGASGGSRGAEGASGAGSSSGGEGGSGGAGGSSILGFQAKGGCRW
jgi:hypothetical protein